MIKEFSIGFSRTVNLGNYESCRIEASVTVAVPEDEVSVPLSLRVQAEEQLRLLLEDTYKAQYEIRRKTA